MPRDLFEKAFQGQPFKPSAQLWNQILDAVRFVMEEERRKGKREPTLTFKYFRIIAAVPVEEFASGPPIAMWQYTGDEVVPVRFLETEYEKDRYKPKAGGLTGVTLYNDAEERDPNYSDETFTVEDADAYGSGEIAANSQGTIPHIPVGRVVRAYYTLVAGGAEWRFNEPNGGTDVGEFWIKITASDEVDAGQEWDYTVSILDDLHEVVSTGHPAKNNWEQLLKAGYQNTSVESLYEIPINAILLARWGQFEDIPTIYFSERNEPNCEPVE